MVTIGIDFGYSAIRVGIYNDFINGAVPKADVLPNDLADRATPTVIAFDNGMRLVGDETIRHSAVSMQDAVYGIQRMIGIPGSHYSDNQSNKNGVNEEMLAFIFHKIKQNAEHELHEMTGTKLEIAKAVISVPACFNHHQRKSVLDAAMIADIEVMRLINNTTAAAVNYMYDILGGQSANLLILDFGASSLEISLIEVNGYESKVISTFGTLLLGGIEFDNRLMNICIHKFTSQYGNDLHFDDGMLHKLRFECEKAKKTLQERNNARIKIDLPNGEIVETQVTKTEFDENCKDLYNNVIHLFIQVISEAQLNQTAVNEIILVGGSSRLKFIEHQLLNAKWKTIKRLNIDEAVAKGGAIFGNAIRMEKVAYDIKIRQKIPFTFEIVVNDLNGDANQLNVENNDGGDAAKNSSLTGYTELPASQEYTLCINCTSIKKSVQTVKCKNTEMVKAYSKKEKTENFAACHCNLKIILNDGYRRFDLLGYKINHSQETLSLQLILHIDENGIFTLKPIHSKTSNDHSSNVKLEPLIESLQNEIKKARNELKSYIDSFMKQKLERDTCENLLQKELFELKPITETATRVMQKNEMDIYTNKISEISEWVDMNSTATKDSLNQQRKIVMSIKKSMLKSIEDSQLKVTKNIQIIKSTISFLKLKLNKAEISNPTRTSSEIKNQLQETEKWLIDNPRPYATETITQLNQLQQIEKNVNSFLPQNTELKKGEIQATPRNNTTPSFWDKGKIFFGIKAAVETPEVARKKGVNDIIIKLKQILSEDVKSPCLPVEMIPLMNQLIEQSNNWIHKKQFESSN